jgi:hypothetical protein
MAHGINAAVEPMQPPLTQPVTDCVTTHTRVPQLPPGNDAVLAHSQFGHPRIPRTRRKGASGATFSGLLAHGGNLGG